MKNDKAIRQRGARGLAGISLIVYLLDKLSMAIHNAFKNGFFGRIFSCYSSELDSYQNGYIVSYFKGGSKTRSFLRAIREHLSKNFETSFILGRIRRGVTGLAYVPLKNYGSFFLSFGIYTLLVYFINMLLPITGTADVDYLYVGISTCIVALPIYFSSLNLADAVRRSRIMSSIFVEAFGYREESFEYKAKKRKTRSGISVLLGLLAGILTFIIHPLVLLAAIFVLVILALIMTSPEIGVLTCLFSLPFLSFTSNPTLLLCTAVLITTIAYLIKLIRGKRIFKVELIDFAVLFFLVLVAFSGKITVGGMDSYYAAMTACSLMFGYFLIVNLMRTEKWLHRCILAIISSGTIVAVIGVLQYLLGHSPNNWIDTDYFTEISGRTTSLFENPNYLAAYLALIFPFAIYQTFAARRKAEKVLMLISCAVIIVCAVFTWSRGAWLAMIITTLIFFLIYSRKTMRLIYLALMAIPFLPFVLPKNIVTRFMSIGDMADSSTLYRVYTWKGSARLAGDYFWGGIGYGTEAFSQLYPAYAYSGMETAVHCHSLYLQILIGMGIAGLISFGMIALFYAQKSFEYLRCPASRDGFLITSAALVAFIALLIMGLFDYVWYNYRIFFMFWVVMAIGIACVRIGKNELSRSAGYEEYTDSSASVDVEA